MILTVGKHVNATHTCLCSYTCEDGVALPSQASTPNVFTPGSRSDIGINVQFRHKAALRRGGHQLWVMECWGWPCGRFEGARHHDSWCVRQQMPPPAIWLTCGPPPGIKIIRQKLSSILYFINWKKQTKSRSWCRMWLRRFTAVKTSWHQPRCHLRRK